MTFILADYQYGLTNFPSENELDIINLLSNETIAEINNLASLVGAPTYQKTPNFSKQQRSRRPPRQKQIISAADWTEIRNFKVTELEKKVEGVEKDIDELRGLLNKLTNNNYVNMKDKIISSLTTIINKNGQEEELEKIGAAIFEIGSINKFWSALYAKLYKCIINTFPLMKNIYERNFKNFMSLFDNIRYVSAEKNYDLFCQINKENEKRRSMASFFVHLMNNDVIMEIDILNLINNLKMNMMNLMSIEDKKQEVEEFSENIVILIRDGQVKLKSVISDNTFNWNNCVDFVEKMTSLKPNSYPSLTNKVIFKFMDLEEEL